MKCQFCGAESIWIEADYYDSPFDKEPHKDICCIAQKTNLKFISKRYDQTDPNKPTLEELAKNET